MVERHTNQLHGLSNGTPDHVRKLQQDASSSDNINNSKVIRLLFPVLDEEYRKRTEKELKEDYESNPLPNMTYEEFIGAVREGIKLSKRATGTGLTPPKENPRT